MDSKQRIENALHDALHASEDPRCPPKLAAALEHAVFPGGARVRPLLCLAVASACGEEESGLSEAFAASIELLHCASLVHDDLPCFDDAELRRGLPSVHTVFGEPIAVLAGDALIVLSFDNLARAADGPGCVDGARLARLVKTLSAASGVPGGLVAGQAWESEPAPDLARYHRAKTASLFCAATQGGAISGGADPGPWRLLGERLGEAYQVADDLSDVMAEGESGKPCGQDQALGRPNAVAELGVSGALRRLHGLIQASVDAIPPVERAEGLRKLVRLQAQRLVPKALRETAA